MVGLVSGTGLGLELSTLVDLKARTDDLAGVNGERVRVNVATGNLVVQGLDESLAGIGQSAMVLRTYNSQGQFEGDHNDPWRLNAEQHARLIGLANQAGSSIERTAGDGSVEVYRFDVGRGVYLGTDGAGAYDRFEIAGSELVWTDGDWGSVERYEGSGAGRLTARASASGAQQTYLREPGGRVSQITNTRSDGVLEYLSLAYTGVHLTSVATVTSEDGAVRSQSRVSYEYDDQNRLSLVRVDLTPEVSSDASFYLTRYEYDGVSNRLARLSQSDGTSLAFAYMRVGNQDRIASVTDGLNQTTRFGWASGATTVTDAFGHAMVLLLDAAGQATRITNAVGAVSEYAYDTAGNLLSATDASGATSTYAYDASGNLISQRDAGGNTVSRVFDAANQLLVETVYRVPDPDGSGPLAASEALSTRYVYAAGFKHLLRFVISPEGRVTEYRYDALGQRTSTLHYTADRFAVGAAPPDEAALTTWSLGAPRSRVQRSDLQYDFRGQIASVTQYASVDTSGNGVADGSESVSRMVYGAHGRLLQTIGVDGGISSLVYDGLGRVITSTDALGQITVTQYDDLHRSTSVSLANGLRRIETRDAANRVTSVMETDGAAHLLGESRFYYDAANRLIMSRNPVGTCHWTWYDDTNRRIAEVDGNGCLSEVRYAADGQVNHTVTWATAVDISRLVDAQGLPVSVALTALRPAAGSLDRFNWNVYDAARRLVKTINADGAVLENMLDGTGRVTEVIRHASLMDVSGLISRSRAGAANLAPGEVLPNPSSNDRFTRQYFDGDGLLRATVDGEANLVECRYDGAGQRVEQISYATPLTGTPPSGIDALLSSVTASADDAHTIWLHNTKGQICAEIDAEGYLTEYIYNTAGQLVQQLRYADRVAGNVTTDSTLSQIRPDASTAQSHRWTYGLLGRLVQEVDAQGAITLYRYDTAGNVIRTIEAAGQPEQRTLVSRYDLQGRLIGELDAIGSAQLSGNQTAEEVDAIWSTHGITHTYDAAGHRIASTDARGATTLFYYDPAGHLTHTINALGEVSEQRYDALGQLTATTSFARPITLSGLHGGLTDASFLTALAAIRDPARDATRSFAMDRAGQLIASINTDGNTTRNSLNAFGEIITSSQLASDGHTIEQRSRYDHNGRLLASANDATGINATTSQQYDAFGRIIQSTDAAGRIHQQKYDRLGQLIQITGPDQSRRSTTWDAFRHVRSETDALGNVTGMQYLANGSTTVTVTTPDGARIETTRNQLGLVASVSRAGQLTVYTYDANGRRIEERLDPEGLNLTQRYTYDANGNLIRSTDPSGAITRYVYDAANRLAGTINAAGGVRLEVRDARGLITRTVAYSQPINLAVLPDTPTLVQVRALLVSSANDASEQRVFDQAGRMLASVNGLGETALYRYDRQGNLLQRTQCFNKVDLTTWQGTTVPTVAADVRDNTTTWVYDGLQRPVFTVDGNGAVTGSVYDAAGNLVSSTRYATLVSVEPGLTVESLQARLSPDVTRDRTTRQVFDALNRPVWNIDARGFVTRNEYDANGRLASTTRYANPASVGSANSLDANTVEAALVPASDQDRRVQYHYDSAGRLTSIQDALGATESYTYNSLGLKTSTTDKNGNTWNYDYDAAGRLVQETAPSVDVTTLTTETTGGLKVDTEHSGPARLITRYVRDALGNVLARTEAAGRPEARTTRYEYDALGRQIKTILPAVGVYDPANDRLDAVTDLAPRSETTRALTIEVTYDALGNAVSNKDAAGITTSRTYDVAGRLVSERDALGNITRHERDGLGEVISTIITSSDGSSSRITLFAYDHNGRLLRQTEPAVSGLDPDAPVGQQSFTAGKTTENVYNAFGDVVLIAQLKNPLARTWTVSTYVVDQRGQRTFSVDAAGFVVTQAFDAVGNVLTTTAYAKPLANWNGLVVSSAAGRYTGTLAVPAGVPVASFDDRTIQTTWDANNRRTSDTLLNVETFDPATNKTIRTNITTRYAYDAVGNLTRSTDATGADSWFQYDALGRVIATTGPQVGSASDGSLITPWIDTRRDAFGNIVVQRQAAGTAVAATTGYTAPASNSTDRFTFTQFDAADHAIQTTDARFINHYSSYNAQGKLAKQWQAVTDANGVTRTNFHVYRYDAAGRQTACIDETVPVYDRATDSTSLINPTETRQYDRWGNLICVTNANGHATRSWYNESNQKISELDAAGRLITWDHDINGQVVAQRISNETISPPASAGASAPTPATPNDSRVTFYRYDSRNHLIETRTPSVTTGRVSALTGNYEVSSGDVITRQELNAFGQVVRSIDANGGVTLIWSDHAGRPLLTLDAEGYAVVQQRDAAGRVVRETRYAKRYGNPVTPGTDPLQLLTTWPTDAADRITTFSYDLSGHLLKTSLLNLAYGTLNNNGILNSATGAGTTINRVNFAGEVVQQTDVNGNVTDITRDAVGNIIGQQLPRFTDANGQSVRVTSEQEWDEANHLRRVIERGSDASSTTDDAIATTLYGAGGRLQQQTDALGQTMAYRYDAVGNVTAILRSRSDADGLLINESILIDYDASNREVRRSMVSDNNGIRTVGITSETRFNVHGEITGTRSYGGTTAPTAWQRIAQYDALGRAWLTTDEKGQDIGWLYDANGNATLKIESQTVDLRTLSAAELLTSPNLQQTITVYDRRNQVIDIIQPSMDASRPVVSLQAFKVDVGSTAGVPTLAIGASVGPASGNGVDMLPSRGPGTPTVSGPLQVSSSIDWGYGVARFGTTSVGMLFQLPALETIFGNYSLRVLVDVTAVITFTRSMVPQQNLTHGEQLEIDNPHNVVVQMPTQAFNSNTSLGYTARVMLTAEGREAQVAEITRSTNSIDRSGLSGSVTASGSNMLRLSNGELIDAAAVALYARPSGSDRYSRVVVTNVLAGVSRPGSYFVDTSPFNGIRTELLFIAVAADGTVLRRGVYTLDGAGRNTPTVSVQPESNQARISTVSGLRADSFGTAIIGASSLDFQGLRFANGTYASNARLRYRPVASSGAYNTITLSQGVARGMFSLNTSPLGTGNVEVVLELYDSAWILKDQLNGRVNLGSAPTLALQYFQTLPATLTFQNLPASATRLTVWHTPTGAGLSGSATLLASSPGSFVWDTSAAGLIADAQLTYSYGLRYTAWDADGLVVSQGQGNVVLGAVGINSSATLTASTTRVITFNPDLPAATRIELRYRVKGQTSALFTTVILNRLASGLFKLDASALSPTLDYEYDYEAFDASNKSLTRVFGAFRADNDPGNDALNRDVRWVIGGLQNSSTRIHRSQSHNAFGEVDAETDGRGNLSTFTYNTLGKLILKTDPQVINTLSNGTQQTIRPITRYDYDRLGQLVASRDANGFTSTQLWNNSTGTAFITDSWAADGGHQRQLADIHGNITARIDELD